MTTRIVVFVVLAIIIMIGWNVMITYVEPQISTEIALGQAEYDSTQAHAAMRSYRQAQPWLYSPIMPWLLVGVIGLALFSGPLGRALKNFNHEGDDL